jgi:hypothetical protein
MRRIILALKNLVCVRWFDSRSGSLLIIVIKIYVKYSTPLGTYFFFLGVGRCPGSFGAETAHTGELWGQERAHHRCGLWEVPADQPGGTRSTAGGPARPTGQVRTSQTLYIVLNDSFQLFLFNGACSTSLRCLLQWCDMSTNKKYFC